MKKLFFALAIIVIGVAFMAFKPFEQPADNKIDWISFQELEDMYTSGDWEKIKRPVFVDVYTDWCGWCKKMDKDVFQTPEISAYVNENYYAVKFDAETDDLLTHRGEDYEYVEYGRKGYNELARELLNDRLSYPTIVFLNDDLQKIQPLPGYRAKTELLPILAFYSQNEYYKKMGWNKFQVAYEKGELK